MSLDENEAHWRSIKSQWPRFLIGCRALAKEFERAHPTIPFVRIALNRGMLWAFKDSAGRKMFLDFQREWKRNMRIIANAPIDHAEKYYGCRGASPVVDSPFD